MRSLRIDVGLSRQRAHAIIAAFAVADVLVILGTWALDVYAREVGVPGSGTPWLWHHLLRQLSLAWPYPFS